MLEVPFKLTAPKIEFEPVLDDCQKHLIVRRGDKICSTNCNSTYVVLGFLGDGSFSRVYKVRLVNDILNNDKNPKYYAMKIYSSSNEATIIGKHEIDVKREIKARLESKCIKNIFFCETVESFQYQNHHILINELLGKSLKERISEDIISFEEIMKIYMHLKLCLKTLHSFGFVHSDIKPENILIDPNGIVKLIDFGSTYKKGQIPTFYVQSRYYRAPEVVFQLPITYKIDLWSLGCVVAEMYLGMPLFPGQNEIHLLHLIQERLGEIPDELIQQSPKGIGFFFDDFGNLMNENLFCILHRLPINKLRLPKITLKEMIFLIPDNSQENKLVLFNIIRKLLEINPEKRS